MRRFRASRGGLQVMGWGLRIMALVLLVPITACCGAPQAPEAAAEEVPMGAKGTVSGITVTFQGDRCLYDGPDRVPAGRLRLTLDVRDQTAHDGYAVVAVTLKEGMTRKDLLAWPSADPPPWTHGLGAVLVPRGELGWQEVWLDKTPLFLVCFTGDPARKIDLLGPIEVGVSAPEARQQLERQVPEGRSALSQLPPGLVP